MELLSAEKTDGMAEIIESVRNKLRELSYEKTRNSSERFFKEKIRVHGVRSALVSSIAKGSFRILNGKSKKEIFELCDELWRSGYIEETFIACIWAYELRKKYEPADFNVFSEWIHKYVDNWASCDTLCNHTLGTFIEMYPEFISALKKWTGSENRWVRRASAVTLIIPARRGRMLPDVLDIADKLLTDGDDMVQKGYGWMLKEASRNHREVIFKYVTDNKKIMPRTALRYAIEKMPPDYRKAAMEK